MQNKWRGATLPNVSQRISLLYFKPLRHYCTGYYGGIEHLTDSCCILRKTAANKTSTFENSTF